MFRILAAVVAVALAGCAQKVLESYVGRPLTDAVLNNGPPSASFDLGDGRRAFVWTKTKQYTMPGTVTTNGSGYSMTNATLQPNGGRWAYAGQTTANLYATTTVTPPSHQSWQCNYAVFAVRVRTDIEGPASWRIVGFHQPTARCN